MIAMHHAIFGRNPIIVNNLLTMSEGDVITYPTRVEVVNAPISIAGFDKSIEFRDNSVARRAYKINFTPISGTTYNLSFFVEMEDAGVPVVGLNTTIGDCSLIINGAISTTAVVELVSGNIYRVSGYRTATSTLRLMGCVKHNTQSPRKFKISGIQLTEGADLKPYKKQQNDNGTNKNTY